jgi:endonuclease I
LALHEIIKGHQRVSYDSIWTHYHVTDENDQGLPDCIYSEYPFQSWNQNQGGPAGQIGSFLTREHSWPKDWWGGTVNDAYSDLFHVILGDAHVNGQKGILPLGEAVEGATLWGVSRVGAARAGLGYTGNVFEPADKYKGDFARNYLYFSIRYLAGSGPLNCADSPMVQADGVTFEAWAIDLLLSWNRDDPPSARETERNNDVYGIQHNRNPFIDHPEYAAAIWGEAVPSGTRRWAMYE